MDLVIRAGLSAEVGNLKWDLNAEKARMGRKAGGVAFRAEGTSRAKALSQGRVW